MFSFRRHYAAVFLPLRAYALTLPPIGFALRSVQTHISKQFHIEMCVCTLLKANSMGERVRVYALRGKINFTLEAQCKHRRLKGSHGAHERRAGVVERIFAAELGLHDEPERVEEAAADAEHRAQGVVGGGVAVPVPLVVVQLGDEVDLGAPRGDIRPLYQVRSIAPAMPSNVPATLAWPDEMRIPSSS